MGILVPIVLFFGLCVVLAGAMSEVAVKSIEGKHSPD